MSASTRSGAARTEPELARLYRATATPEVVDVPGLTFLMIDGHGDPNTSPAYAQAVQALYAVSYAIKFAIRRSGGTDHKVAPLEGLWWAADMTDFSMERKSNWDWTLMIRQPGEATADLVARTAVETAAKKRIPAARDLRLEIYVEGRAAQVLHVGPYAAEAPTIARLHAFISDHGCVFDGKHHEIYLGDPRRTSPDRLKTIIRQPFAAASSSG